MDYTRSSISFPREILNEIIQYLPRDTQATLIGVSRTFRSICTPYAYRNPILRTLPSLMNFCNILTCNEAATEAVRSICFDINVGGGEYDYHYLDNVLLKHISRPPVFQLSSREKRIFRNVLRNIAVHVVELIVLTLPHDLASCIPIRFPMLRSYISGLTVSQKTITFIKYNSQLHEIRLLGQPPSKLPTSKQVVKLPNLRLFVASAHAAPFFLSGSKLTHVIWAIDSYATRDAFDASLTAIRDSGVKVKSIGFNFTFSLVREWLFPGIPQYFPEAKSLNVSGIYVNNSLQHLVCVQVERILPRMKKLRKIEIEAQHVSAITFLPEDLDKELERLKIWSKLSTSLCQVLMPLSNTLWTRVEQDSDIWMPTCNKRQHMLWLSQRPEYSHLINDLSKKDTKEDEAMSSFPPQIHSRELDDEVILNTERFSDGSKVMMGPLLHVKPWIGPYGVVYVPRPQERDDFSVPDN